MAFSGYYKVTIIDTGKHTLIGSYLTHIKEHFKYRYVVSNIDITKSIEFYENHGKITTNCGLQVKLLE